MIRALVTGGSGAIGAAICRKLAAGGRHVIVHANTNMDEATRLADDLRSTGFSAEAVQFDVVNGDACKDMIERVIADGPVQILVNNAGIHDDAPMAGMAAQQWQRVIDVSLNGFYNVTQPLLLPMIRSRWGRIINVSSVAAIMGNRGQTNYAAAKAALHGASRALSLELASRGITVNVVAPGIIESGMTDGVFAEEFIKRTVPMQRAGKPEEVAAVVDFLASDAAAYISGQVISVNGGMA